MQAKVIVFIIQFLIYSKKYSFISAKALLGHYIRSIDPNEFLSVVCIIRVRALGTLTENVSCTGTLISTQLVLTAEQCFHNYGDLGFVINAGSNNITASPNYFPIWWLSYDTWADIVGIPRGNAINDIGIIKVNAHIQEANIPVILTTPTSNLVGQFIEVVGCGRGADDLVPQIKQTVPVYVLTNPECETRTAILRGEMGDIGGPLIADDVLIGINLGKIPLMNGIFHPDKVNLHLKIDGYRNFIESLANF